MGQIEAIPSHTMSTWRAFITRDFLWTWLSRFLIYFLFTTCVNYMNYYLQQQVHFTATTGQPIEMGVQFCFLTLIASLLISSVVCGLLSDRLQKQPIFLVLPAQGNLLDESEHFAALRQLARDEERPIFLHLVIPPQRTRARALAAHYGFHNKETTTPFGDDTPCHPSRNKCSVAAPNACANAINNSQRESEQSERWPS